MAKRTPKGQGQLIETDHPEDKKLIEAAEAYREIRDERMAKTQEEIEARTGVLALMKDRKLTTYKHDGLLITVESEEKLKVKVLEDGDEAEEEEGDE